MEELKKIWAHYLKQEKLIRATCEALGNIKLEGLMTTLEKLLQEKTVVELEAKVKFILAKIEKL